jgi:hypothetical protein
MYMMIQGEMEMEMSKAQVLLGDHGKEMSNGFLVLVLLALAKLRESSWWMEIK